MTASPPESLSVRFTADASDVEQRLIREWIHRGTTPPVSALTPDAKFWRSVALVLSLAVALAGFVAMAYEWIPAHGLIVAALIVGPLVCASILNPPQASKPPLATEAQARTAARSATARIGYGPHLVSVSEDGLRCITDHYDILFRWPCIVSVDSTPDAVYVKVVGTNDIRVPERAFDAVVPQNRFIAAINYWIAHRGAEMEARFLALAQINKLTCSKCGYSLAELAHARCPECGKVLTMDEYPLVTKVLPASPISGSSGS